MRQATTAALAVSLFALGAGAAGAADRGEPQARSAGAFVQEASYRGPILEHGYTAKARHVADCLATYRNYDPRRDRLVVRPGVTRACTL